MMKYMNLILCFLALLVSGCVTHIKPYKAKRRLYELPVPHAARDAGRSSGSLFSSSGIATRLTTDARAQSVNDVVVVVIEENATATRDTNTETGRQDEQSAELADFLGLIGKLETEYPGFNGAAALNLTMENKFKGSGRTSRSDKLKATVPAMVRNVLPNGNLFIEGHRVVLVNKEEHHFYISGVIRPDDIDGTGQVLSSRMADAQIEFTGRGELTAGSGKGWFSTLLDYVFPF